MQDADPLKGKRPYGDSMRLAFTALLLVIGARPERMAHRFTGPFDKNLAQEFRATIAPVDPGLVSAAVSHRRDTGILQEIAGVGKTVTVFAESGQQSRGELFTCAG